MFISRNFGAPSSLLVPEELRADFLKLLANSNYRIGILLRKLVQTYRAACFAGEFPQMASPKKVYQEPGKNLVKYTFRVEDSVWLEFGQMASYLGVSKCLMFVFLLEAARDSLRQDEGVPTSRIAAHDLWHPAFFEYHERLWPGRLVCERRFRIIPCRYEDIPYYIRYEAERSRPEIP